MFAFEYIHLTKVITYHFLNCIFICLMAIVAECISSEIIAMLMDFYSAVRWSIYYDMPCFGEKIYKIYKTKKHWKCRN